MNSSSASQSRLNDIDGSATTYPRFVIVLTITSSLLSIIGSFVIFGTYLAIPEIRKFTRKLMVCLTVADFLAAVGYMLGASSYAIQTTGHQVICEIQSYITTYSSMVSFWLTTMTAVHIFTIVIKRTDFPDGKRLLLYNAVSWIIPAVITAVAGSKNVLGSTERKGTGPWCWVKADNDIDTEMWQWVTGKGWEIACYLITTTLYVLLKLHLYLRYRHERLHDLHSSLRNEDRNFLYVWFVFYIIRLWGTVRFLISTKEPKTHTKVLLHFQALGDPAQAFCNCILFCLLDETVRRRLFGACSCRVCQNDELHDPVLRSCSVSGEGKRSTHERTPIAGRKPPEYGSSGDEHFSTNIYEDDNKLVNIVISAQDTERLSRASFGSINSQGDSPIGSIMQIH